jgi:hypothetical protein
MKTIMEQGQRLCPVCHGHGAEGESCINPECDLGTVLNAPIGRRIEEVESIMALFNIPRRYLKTFFPK